MPGGLEQGQKERVAAAGERGAAMEGPRMSGDVEERRGERRNSRRRGRENRGARSIN